VRLPSAPVAQLWRFIKIGVVNTLFGYALYALMVAIGLQLYVAQIVATVIAIIFNYFTYGRYVFGGIRPSRLRFLLSYALNYLVSLGALALSAAILRSPYLAGLLATAVAAAINFIVLRRFVFISPSSESGFRKRRPSEPAPVREPIQYTSYR
jgi:putative flippase GtrA